ncbi:hypothetical protein ACTPEM_26895, partial [Clostridioides difficile]
LITNFKEESSFWSNAENNVDMEKYNTILTNRKAISQNISKEAFLNISYILLLDLISLFVCEDFKTN